MKKLILLLTLLFVFSSADSQKKLSYSEKIKMYEKKLEKMEIQVDNLNEKSKNVYHLADSLLNKLETDKKALRKAKRKIKQYETK